MSSLLSVLLSKEQHWVRGMGGDTIYPSITHRHFTWAILPPHPWVLQLVRVYCAFSYPDDLGKAGSSFPDWLRPTDPILACCACRCSWKPSSDRLWNSTMNPTFLLATYVFCKDRRLGNDYAPPEYFVSYTLGDNWPTSRLSLTFFICIVFFHIFSELLLKAAFPFYFSVMQLALSISHFSSLNISRQL